MFLQKLRVRVSVMHNILIVMRREWSAYFYTPIAALYLIIFLALSAALTFYVGGFYEREIADLEPFFQFHPWIYLILVPAIGMRLWSEEYRSGSAELLLTLPLSTFEVVLGKYLAALGLIGLGLALSFPIWITVNVLGDPDNGVIVGGYLGSWLMAGGFLAISTAASAATSNQVVAFIASSSICFALLMAGMPLVLGPIGQVLPQVVVDAISQSSFLVHYSAMARGILDLKSGVYFVGLISLMLVGNWALIEFRKAP